MSLNLTNISKKNLFETHIYSSNLILEKNSINVLLGPTLSGKTTLMRLIAGLDEPSTGKIYFNKKDVTKDKVQKRNVSMVYQQFINYPSLTVYENIASPLRVLKHEPDFIHQKVIEVASLLKLNNFLEKRPHQLSGGQQQRTALARALIKNADLILLDEPLANLDFKLREELREELPKIFTKRDCIVIYATTDPMDALLIGGNTIVINEGKIVQYGKTIDVYKNPSDLISAKVFNDPPLNVFESRIKNGIVNINNIEFHLSKSVSKNLSGNYKVCIRPHHLKNKKEEIDDVEIEGKVRICEINGSETLIHFDYNKLNYTSLINGIFNYSIQDTVKFYFKPSNCLIFNSNNKITV
jgi:glycerol transport system ATP-binding protein